MLQTLTRDEPELCDLKHILLKIIVIFGKIKLNLSGERRMWLFNLLNLTLEQGKYHSQGLKKYFLMII